jgi:sortase (surface protein transpeptidase)
MLYVNRHIVSEPADTTEPIVTVDETVIVNQPDPEISVRIAEILLDERVSQPKEVAEAPVAVVIDELEPVIEETKPVLNHGVPELPLEKKVDAITKALEKARNDLDKEYKKRFAFKRLTLGLIGVVLLLSTGYIGLDTWMANNKVKADTSQTTAVNDSPNPVPDPNQEGKDTSPLPANALANYNVSSSLPRALYIDKINVAARLLQMNVNNDGTVQAPRNIFDAGWYTGSVKPGELGAMFVDGHSSGSSHLGLFGNLDSLAVGDTMQIEKGDGTRLVYKVAFKETVKLENVDMKKALKPYGNATKGLNLMTCAGGWTSDDSTMTERTIVYTQQI